MYTAMYDFKDKYSNLYHLNARIGGFRTKEQAIKAIIRKSPLKQGTVQIGQRIISVVVRGKELAA